MADFVLGDGVHAEVVTNKALECVGIHAFCEVDTVKPGVENRLKFRVGRYASVKHG